MNKTGCHSLVVLCVSAAVLVASTRAQDAGKSTAAEGPAVRVESGMVPAVIYLWPKGNVPAITKVAAISTTPYADPPAFRPNMQVFPAKEGMPVKGAVILCSGGAFSFRNNRGEGEPVARALSQLGYQCFVVNYRLRPYTQQEGALDLARAVRYVRSHATDYGIREKNIAVAGFSAGGILCGELLLHFKGKVNGTALDSRYVPDELDQVSADASAIGHIYSFYGRLSVASTDVELFRRSNLPPAYFCYGTKDPFVNEFSACAKALQQAGVSVESNILRDWPHGYGARGNWVTDFDRWLMKIFENGYESQRRTKEIVENQVAAAKGHHLTSADRIRDLANHPAFGNFGPLMLPWDNRASDAKMPLRDIGSLLPYHSHVNPDILVSALNHLIDEVNNGKTIFYDFYTESEKQAEPGRTNTGLFFVRGKPGAPFAIVAPGGGFSYVASVHEGFPYAVEISHKGFNAFVLKYRAGCGSACAIQDMASAITFIFRNAERLGVGTRDYSLWGSSAGARMAAAIGSHGVRHFGGGELPKPSTVVMAYTGHSDYSSDEPATFVVVGEQDAIAPASVMQSRVNALRRSGTDVEFHKYPNLGHGFGPGTGTSAEGWIADAIRFWVQRISTVK